MKALVTGGAGFVGRHMRAELVARGWQVSSCDIEPGYDSDVVAMDCREWFETVNVHYDLVVHAAASAPHRAAIDREPVHFARNLQLDAAMFEWAQRTKQGRVIYLSSSAAYPAHLQDSAEYGRLDEGLINFESVVLGTPDAVYGWTKLTGEQLAAGARAYGVPVTVVRPFSGYALDQSPDFPFRAILDRARARLDPFPLWGDGQQVRDWIHITDVVRGALAVADSGTTRPVNLCTGVGTSIIDVARIACEVAGFEPEFEFHLNRPAGVGCRVGDPRLMNSYYLPRITLRNEFERALGVRAACR